MGSSIKLTRQSNRQIVFIVDSDASMHMMNKKDLSSEELKIVNLFWRPTTVLTTDGSIDTIEEERLGYIRHDPTIWTHYRKDDLHVASITSPFTLFPQHEMNSCYIALMPSVRYKRIFLYVDWSPLQKMQRTATVLLCNVKQKRDFSRQICEVQIYSCVPDNADSRCDGPTHLTKSWISWRTFHHDKNQKGINKQEVIEEARKEDRTVHFATLIDPCHLKNIE